MDRRWLRRKLGFWRFAAIAILALAVVGAALLLRGPEESWLGGDQIARISIEGVVTEDRDLLRLMDGLRTDPKVRAVILRIDSPGGTTTGGETIYEAARAIAEVKPVAAEVGSLAASAGYMIASAADHIVAHNTSIVGSIGVLIQFADASKLLDTIGVKIDAVKSAPLKAEPSPFHPTDPEARAMLGRIVADTYGWFVDLVAERRKMSREDVLELADGSIFTGQQGVKNGLVDTIGGEVELRAWLEAQPDMPKGLAIVDRKPDREGRFAFIENARSAAFSLVGLDPSARSLAEALAGPAARLDGLVSLWQLR
ncbi:signal peptide peptidase SppA [Consotaella salsifontis]